MLFQGTTILLVGRPSVFIFPQSNHQIDVPSRIVYRSIKVLHAIFSKRFEHMISHKLPPLTRTREVSKLVLVVVITRRKYHLGSLISFTIVDPMIGISSSPVVVSPYLLFTTINSTFFLFIVPLERFLVLWRSLVMDVIYWRFPLWFPLIHCIYLSFHLASTTTSKAFLGNFSV